MPFRADRAVLHFSGAGRDRRVVLVPIVVGVVVVVVALLAPRPSGD